MKKLTLLLLLLLLGACNFVQARDVEVAIAAYTYRKFTFFETVEKVADLGVPNLYGFNFQAVGGGIDGVLDPAKLSDADLQKIRDFLASKKITLCALYYGSFPDDEAECRRIFERSKSLGVKRFVSEPKPELLPMLDKLAGEYGMIVGLHGHSRQASPNTWHPILVANQCRCLKNVGAFNDTGHWLRSGLAPTDGIEILGKYTVGFDLHDTDAEGKDVPLGTGTGNIGLMLHALQRIPGPPVLIGIEYNSNPDDPTEDVKKCLEFLKDPKPDGFSKKPDGFYVGAVSIDITPNRPVSLPGQHYTRISEGANTPVEANVLLLDTVQEGLSTPVVFISFDAVGIGTDFNLTLRDALQKALPDVNTENIIMCVTHTHDGPTLYGDPPDPPTEGDYMKYAEFRDFAISRIVPAVQKAWEARVPARYGFGLSYANIAYNRRAIYADGTAVMYGKTDRPDFRAIEGMTDTDLNILCFWNEKDEPIAMMLNVACPSQENEHYTKLDADFWGDLRPMLQKKYGKNLVVLGVCGAAGDQSPHIRYRQAAEVRMQKLRGLERDQELARRLFDAVDDVYDLIAKDKRTAQVVKFEYIPLDLPVRKISQAEYDAAAAEVKKLDEEYAKTKSSYSLIRGNWQKRTLQRWDDQQKGVNQTYATSICVMRLDQIAICTNQFELYNDFGLQIKARSKALQTFVIQLCTGRPESGSYLPTAFAVKGGGYGAVPASNKVGPEGGQILVEKTLEAIEREFE